MHQTQNLLHVQSQGVGSPDRVRFELPREAEHTEETYKLLEGLGPRFTDWWGCEPLPIDTDLLLAIVHGYNRPFRLLPYGVKPKLTNDEMTTLRRIGRPLPCHFVLGRNRKLQGLAAAIVKLWDKCEIAKVSFKRGFQKINSELMAEELKILIFMFEFFMFECNALENNAEAEKLLLKLEEDEVPQQFDMDKEGITEEERFMLRKIGLRMKPFLLLGRRGVIDGKDENMHLHWKYRELVTVITGRKNIEEVHQIARMLEEESGGILVAAERVNKCYAIIVLIRVMTKWLHYA
ncbi:hypothetical protein MTR67_026235 [Solanum verrucosum]|uniref:CRM domain-containing protein n=1 Tax=Solanum verrucosum TaxID=315347 RepID=A0AAF0R540_SOLVR|nr:hypothetical protein MTR67_026235 [Solanum verrucosum]